MPNTISHHIPPRADHGIGDNSITPGAGPGNIVKGSCSLFGRMVGWLKNPPWSSTRHATRQQSFNTFQNSLSAFQNADNTRLPPRADLVIVQAPGATKVRFALPPDKLEPSDRYPQPPTNHSTRQEIPSASQYQTRQFEPPAANTPRSFGNSKRPNDRQNDARLFGYLPPKQPRTPSASQYQTRQFEPPAANTPRPFGNSNRPSASPSQTRELRKFDSPINTSRYDMADNEKMYCMRALRSKIYDAMDSVHKSHVADIAGTIAHFSKPEAKMAIPIAVTLMENAKNPDDARKMAYEYIVSANVNGQDFSSPAVNLGIRFADIDLSQLSHDVENTRKVADLVLHLVSGSGKTNYKEAFKKALVAQSIVKFLKVDLKTALKDADKVIKYANVNGLDFRKAALRYIQTCISKTGAFTGFRELAKSLGTRFTPDTINNPLHV